MLSMDGRVILVQESRFQLLDRNGIGHHFILGHAAGAEPQQLAALQARQASVRVRYKQADDIVALTATRIDLLGP